MGTIFTFYGNQDVDPQLCRDEIFYHFPGGNFEADTHVQVWRLH